MADEVKEITTGKVARKYLAHFIDAAFDLSGTKSVYVRLGADLEEFNTEMNANVESKQNIMGETSIVIDSYQPSDEVEPFYYAADDALAQKLETLADARAILDELKTSVVDVKLFKGADKVAVPAWKEEVFIEIKSVGGDNTGYQIPFTIHRTGIRTEGTFNMTAKAFTEKGSGGVGE